MIISTECRENIDFSTLSSESFANMLKGDINRVIQDYEKEYNLSFDKLSFKVEIDYDYSPQDISRYIIVNNNIIDNAIKAFESIKSSKNFVHGRGWKIDYEIDENNRIIYRPIVYITFEEDYAEKIEKNKQEKLKDIMKFNSTLGYKGD